MRTYIILNSYNVKVQRFLLNFSHLQTYIPKMFQRHQTVAKEETAPNGGKDIHLKEKPTLFYFALSGTVLVKDKNLRSKF